MSQSAPPSKEKGCFKCGGTGHWSRDCPQNGGSGAGPSKQSQASDEKPWKSRARSPPRPPVHVPRKRPKLTPELLLSKDGLGFVLEKLPKQVTIKGKGHEVGDLKRLLEAYILWQKNLFSYVDFPQFVELVEKLGTTKRVRMTIRELRDKIFQKDRPNDDDEHNADDMAGVGPNTDGDGDGPSPLFDNFEGDAWGGGPDDAPEDVPDDVLDDVWGHATDNPGPSTAPHPQPQPQPSSSHAATAGASAPSSALTAEQRARMEANRLAALARRQERLAAAATTPPNPPPSNPSTAGPTPPSATPTSPPMSTPLPTAPTCPTATTTTTTTAAAPATTRDAPSAVPVTEPATPLEPPSIEQGTPVSGPSPGADAGPQANPPTTAPPPHHTNSTPANGHTTEPLRSAVAGSQLLHSTGAHGKTLDCAAAENGGRATKTGAQEKTGRLRRATGVSLDREARGEEVGAREDGADGVGIKSIGGRKDGVHGDEAGHEQGQLEDDDVEEENGRVSQAVKANVQRRRVVMVDDDDD